jgi:hypothetical protein
LGHSKLWKWDDRGGHRQHGNAVGRHFKSLPPKSLALLIGAWLLATAVIVCGGGLLQDSLAEQAFAAGRHFSGGLPFTVPLKSGEQRVILAKSLDGQRSNPQGGCGVVGPSSAAISHSTRPVVGRTTAVVTFTPNMDGLYVLGCPPGYSYSLAAPPDRWPVYASIMGVLVLTLFVGRSVYRGGRAPRRGADAAFSGPDAP